ncbi:hypothetical protein BHE74_00022968 [Ensete ventricosum]|nr:hypothetical protein BHE74_00022968 [Ensete ventricosum]
MRAVTIVGGEEEGPMRSGYGGWEEKEEGSTRVWRPLAVCLRRERTTTMGSRRQQPTIGAVHRWVAATRSNGGWATTTQRRRWLGGNSGNAAMRGNAAAEGLAA